MKKLYLVTSGSYSDYGVDAIFDSKELAQSFIDAFDKESTEFNDIEEWELNPLELELKANRKAYKVFMYKNGNTESVRQSTDAYSHRKSIDISFRKDKSVMNVYCYANDEKHAIKIANEKRTEILALNKWGEIL